MKSIETRKDFELCYPILENGINAVYDKIAETLDERVGVYELRIDYLLQNRIEMIKIIDCINDLKSKFHNKSFILTIRTKSEGGVINLDFKKYYSYIKLLFDNTNADFIDIEYKYYILSIERFDKLFNKSKMKILLSRHIFDKSFSKEHLESCLKELVAKNVDIVKLAMMVNTKKDLFEFMNISQKYSKFCKKDGKRTIFIAMGEMGKLSRVFHEYINTSIVFLNAYKNSNDLGQCNLESYLEYRKLLAKVLKN